MLKRPTASLLFLMASLLGTNAQATTIPYAIGYHPNHAVKNSAPVKAWADFSKQLESITPEKNTLISKKLKDLDEIEKNASAIAFYRPTYILPAYYTSKVSPWYALHPGSTPSDQQVKHLEAKAQLSIIFPVWTHMFGEPWSASFSYTQLNYWQVYAESPYFRETDYEPQLFFTYYGLDNWFFSAGLDHQSNGRGGTGPDAMERSWNRIFAQISFSGEHWFVSVMPWVMAFKHSSSDCHNPDIGHYLGYEKIIASYAIKNNELSMMLRNTIESGFKRGAIELTYTFPLYHKTKGMLTFFSGYGQNLMEYKHYTNAFGLGISLSNWM